MKVQTNAGCTCRTFRPVKTTEAIYEKLEYIASLLEHDLEASGWAGRVVILTVKRDTFRCLSPFKTNQRTRLALLTLNQQVSLDELLLSA